MRRHRFAATVGLAIALAAGGSVALAELERVGPTDPQNGYPRWYQDTTGITFEFGAPLNQAELDGGWLLIGTADVPSGTAPETFPTDFAVEHFYWSAETEIDFVMPDGDDGRARLVLAVEASFAAEIPRDGDQIVFGRLRIRMDDVPFNGDYTVYTPYGVRTYTDQVAGERLFETEDIGIGAPGDFSGALTSSVGPFLLPSNTPGGAELAPITGPVPGKLYICDPGREGPVTGSPLPPFVSPVDGLTRNHNIFRIEGPNGFVLETTNFSMAGRLYTGPMPGRVTVDRSSYIRTPTELRTEVYATGLLTLPSRLPTAAIPARVLPLLSYFNAPPVVDPGTGELSAPPGEPEVPMSNTGNWFWGRSQPATVPSGVALKDSNTRNAFGAVVPTFFGSAMTDEIAIAQAHYDPSDGGRLLVKAQSSDEVNPPVLTLAGLGTLTNGEILVSPLAAPPSKIKVLSSAGGSNEHEVKTWLVPSPIEPLALDDEATTNQGTPVIIDVLNNDTYGGAPISFGPGVQMAVVDAPLSGTAQINADGTITYAPDPDAAGIDLFHYTVTINAGTSCPATVRISINSPPTAEPQAIIVTAGQTQVITLTATDDGPEPITFAILTPPADGVLGPLNEKTGVVTYTPNPGATSDSFTFTATDGAGMTSAPATVTLTMIAAQSGDFDGDGLVAVSDLDIFQACATGPGILYDPANLPAGCAVQVDQGLIPPDFDRDGDVDMDDFGVFQRCFSGEDQPADPACAG